LQQILLSIERSKHQHGGVFPQVLGPERALHTSLGKIPHRWRMYKSPEVEIVNLSMLNFAESPGNHRSLLFGISTRSLLGNFRYKICCPLSRQSVPSQADSVKHHNEIAREQFEIHRIVERIDAVDKMTKYCRNPSPRWLRLMIMKLYKQMTKIRIHAEKKCRKILRPESKFSPMFKCGMTGSTPTYN
jgi:hypothetical protein